jgi:integrase
MARATTPLTDAEIKRGKSKEKEYTLADGGGLLLRVSPNGVKVWFFNYYHPYTKKRNKISFGVYPTVSLANARKEREIAKTLLSDNIDPKSHREKQKREKAIEHSATLLSVYQQWLSVWREGKDETTVKKAIRHMELYALPAIGSYPLKEITAPLVIGTLRSLEKQNKLETLGRVRTKLNQVMIFAVNTGVVEHNPLSKISAAFGSNQVTHQPAIHPKELPELLQAIKIANLYTPTRYLILWSLHTLLRPSEVAGTRWDEIDFKERLWHIPADRMKGKRRDHCVPLTNQALDILQNMRQISGHLAHVFPSQLGQGQPAHKQTANRALVRMGYKGRQTAHGLRSLGSTALNEQQFSPDVIEAALAHIDKNEVRRAYNRSDYLQQRRAMMTWWSDYIEQASTGNIDITGNKTLKIVGH